MRLNITQKLILVIIVLVIVPVLATGLTANRAAKQIVTQLLNESQIALAREIAEQASQLFKTARADIKILSALPALSDYHYNRFYNLHSEADISRSQIGDFFLDMAKKSKFYHRISYLNAEGLQIVNITQSRILGSKNSDHALRWPIDEDEIQNAEIYISPILTVDEGRQRIIRFSKPLFDVWDNVSGVVRLELDFNEFSKQILSRRVGLNGFAFVVDTDGRIQVHPESNIWDKMVAEVENDSLAELITKMLHDRQGMASYDDNGSKVAAFTPVEENGWIVAVALPESEFAQRVNVIGKQMLLIVIFAASITLCVGILFSWQFVKPIKQMAQATNVISAGGLPAQLESTSKDELGILTRSFNHMVRNLRRVQAELVRSEKLVSLGRLATGVAHEIRNPLNDMKIATEVLSRKEPTAQETEDLVNLIADEIAHLDSFVTEFLSYARQPPLKMIDFDANQLVADVLQTANQKVRNNKIELIMDLNDDLPSVTIDPFQMERALLNIVANAVDAMPDGGSLWVSTALSSDNQEHFLPQIRIAIVDSGTGLTAEQLDRVFDPFFTTKDHGTGLGLSLTKSIVEAHDGSISISPNQGPGLTVEIYLPFEASRGDEM